MRLELSRQRRWTGILITHEHVGSCEGAGSSGAENTAFPFMPRRPPSREVQYMSSLGKMPEELFHPICADERFSLGDIEGAAPCTFPTTRRIRWPTGWTAAGKSAAVATDLGIYDDYIVDNLQELDALLLEANHDIHMLEVGAYPYHLKQRILGEQGHLSNETVRQAFMPDAARSD